MDIIIKVIDDEERSAALWRGMNARLVRVYERVCSVFDRISILKRESTFIKI